MVTFISEIRNSPTQQTIKVFLSDESLYNDVKGYLESIDEAKQITLF